MEMRKETGRRKRQHPQSRRAAGVMFAVLLAAVCLMNLVFRGRLFPE